MRSTIFFLVGLSALAGCGDDDDGGSPARDEVTAVRGTITAVNGDAIEGVEISSGSVTATSDSDGKYELDVAAGARVVLFEDAGYVTVSERVEVVADSPTQLDVTLAPMAAGVDLDADEGGTVTGMRGASLVAPAGAFVTRGGDAVTGEVTVHLTAIDPSDDDELRAAPGDFTAELGGQRMLIESFGMLDITVMQGDEVLDVADDKELEVRIPVAAGADDPAAVEQLWSFDETKGLWVDEGDATFDEASRTYVARIPHLSAWNIDRVVEATCLCGHVFEKDEGPLPGARIQAFGLDYFGTTDATADEDGYFCIGVRKDSRVSVGAYHASGGGMAREVMSGDADTEVPVVFGAPGCVDIGNFEVERDVFVGSDGMVTSCEDASDPFGDGCGSDLWGLFECYRPMGACTFEGSATGTTIMYANGARAVSVTDVTAGRISSTYYDAGGDVCGTSVTEVPEDGAPTSVTYETPNGDQFSLTIPDGDTGNVVIGCPDGSEATVTPAQRQALEACGGTGSPQNNTMCTPAGGGPGGCTDDDECMSGETCCTIAAGLNYCVPEESCAAATACMEITCETGEICNPSDRTCCNTMTGMCREP